MTTQRPPAWGSVADEFLNFFRAHDHTLVPSSPLVPSNDPTLLFTNAGMVQFKDIFLGLEQRGYRRAASLQKCMRVQGKHNDLENVGPSPRHHTFFLMLGNFSFGDYFKGEAIAHAWNLLTGGYGIDPGRLVITVFETDDEAVAAWRGRGVATSRILRLGEKTNFWTMGDVGPCGPTTEVHYDWGPTHCTCHAPDCSVALDNNCLRWLEVWNLVFMQYAQQADGSRVPLPAPGVDTGMGLERITSVLQGINDDYGTDLFVPMMDRLQRILSHTDDQRAAHRVAYRVMADHGRAMTFLMGDGVVPGNEGRGYVLRMIMRRAIRFGRSAGLSRPFLGDLAEAMIAQMGARYPELQQHRAFMLAAARNEEERFAQTLSTGMNRLEEMMAAVEARRGQILPGEDVFRLYDTFGFPVEMTRDVARERGLQLDEEGLTQAMAAQRERARGAQMFSVPHDERQYAKLLAGGVVTEFLGYTKASIRAKIVTILVGGQQVEDAGEGTEVEVILDRTPFYPEGGGQVGDTGFLSSARCLVEVRDTRRPAGGLILHVGKVVRGHIRLGQSVRAEIDRLRRWDIMRNHTATHLLHKALREVLGEHARQAGSLVAPDRLRFDFVHLAALSSEERAAIEERVNEKILEDVPVRARWMTYEEAIALGAMALFGEKYGDRVRVISIDGYSRELCGGTHLARTSQIGSLKFTSESSIAAGVRRIEAVTGRGAYALMAKQDSALRALAETIRSTPDELTSRVRALVEENKQLRNEIGRQHLTHVRDEIRERTLRNAVEVDGVLYVSGVVGKVSPEAQLALADDLRASLEQSGKAGVVCLAAESTGQIVTMRTRVVEPPIDVGQFARVLAEEFGGSGGGRPSLGRGGLKDPNRIHELVEKARDPEFLKGAIRRLA